MIKKILFCTAAIVAIFSICNLRAHRATSNTSGAPAGGGYTGAPADQSRTCRTCHGPGSAPEKPNAFSSNIPVGGYVPGETYQVSLTLTEAGRSKFGFEAVATDANNIKRGTFSGSGAVQALSGARVTHTTSGTGAPGGTKTWTFNWKAPSTGVGTITFYAAMNATNRNGNDDSGDNIYTATMAVNQDPTAEIADYLKGLEKLKIYPNPASDVLNIEAAGSKVESINVYNLAGQLVLSTNSPRFDVSGLKPGPYLLKVQAGEVLVSRFVKE